MERNYETALAKKGAAGFLAENWKTILTVAALLLIIASPIFSQDNNSVISQVDDMAESVKKLFNSNWTRALCVVALIIRGLIAVGQFQNGGGIDALKPLIGWAVGLTIIMCAGPITEFFWKKNANG